MGRGRTVLSTGLEHREGSLMKRFGPVGLVSGVLRARMSLNLNTWG